MVAFLHAHATAKAHISGFHDPTGDAEHNDALAKNRAKTVGAALIDAGVAAGQIVMEKPTTTTGTGPAHEARRVEVSVTP